jgi:putative glutamine amidotransferase
MQLMAVARGGSLLQHVPEVIGHDDHRPLLGVYGWHTVRLAEGSRAVEVLGTELKVNAHHHQAVSDPADLTVTGWAEDDLIEVVEDPALRFMLGVQWHPESTDDPRLFQALVTAAR